MNFKGLAIFVLCFVGIQGCFNESLMKRFNATDLDQDGFLTKDEVCQALGKGPKCDQLWRDFDADQDGKASCQEVSISYATVFVKPAKAEQIKKIFLAKKENCRSFSVKEMRKILLKPNEEVDDLIIRMTMHQLDLNQDGMVSCKELIVELVKPSKELFEKQNSK